jgi:hypothetical protein
MRCALSVAALAAIGLASSASAAVLYSTNFDSSQGYAVGDINGQNGWSIYQPGGGGGFANITSSAPAGFGGDHALEMNSGIDANTSPRYAWPAAYGAAFTAEASAGNNVLYTQCSMYMASGSASTERTGLVSFDSTGAKLLSGFYVQANTGIVYLLAYYNNAGTLNNYAFNTNATIGFDQWVNFSTTWNQATGRMEVFWGANGFYVDGAGAGSVADETDFYATRNGSTVANSVYFDNLEIGTVPAPGALALLGLAGLAGRRRR